MMNIAHRGFSSQYPENTILAFQKALELGVNWLELDLQVTSDGHLIVLHDLTVDRRSDGSGAASEFTLDEIKSLDAGSWMSGEFTGQRIPTFQEIFDELDPSTFLVVELKFEGTDAIEKVIQSINENNASERVVISTFDLAKLPIVKQLAPELPMTALLKSVGRTPSEMVTLAQDLGVDTLGPSSSDITEETIKVAHEAGLLVRAHGLGEDQGEEMNRIIDLGVDGMTTNYPDVLQRILTERGMI